MVVVVRDGAAGRLVVEPGDRVRATGRMVRFPDGDWLDLAQISDLVLRAGPWKSARSVRLHDPDAVVVRCDTSAFPGRVCAVGRWRDDVITVESLEPELPHPHAEHVLLAATAPEGGWDDEDQSTVVDGLEQLRDSGLIVRDGWLRTDNGALILRVAASDPDAVRAVLAPQLPRRLHVAHTRFTAAHLREVGAVFGARHGEWGFEGWSYEGLDAQSQPYADAVMTRVHAELAAWADSLPDGLLALEPAMSPVLLTEGI